MKKECVLVIDRCAESASLLVEMLRVHSIEAHTCHNVDGFLKINKKLNFTIIIVNLTSLDMEIKVAQFPALVKRINGGQTPLLVALMDKRTSERVGVEVIECFDELLAMPSFMH